MSTFALGQLQSGVVKPLTPSDLAGGPGRALPGAGRGRRRVARITMPGRNVIRIHRYLAVSAFRHATAMDTAMIAATLKARICPVRACPWF